MMAKVKKRRKLVSTPSPFRPGQRQIGQKSHGGGGPENVGAKSIMQAGVSLRQGQPPHAGEADSFGEYGGYAAPSIKPDLSGRPANNFRGLGDHYGGRQ